jgi:hypothetical protein
MTSADDPGDDDLQQYGQALADVDDRLNRALQETDGDELAAEELLRREEEGSDSAS